LKKSRYECLTLIANLTPTLEKGNFQFVGIACYPVMFSIIIKVEEIFSVFGPISLTEYRHKHFRKQAEKARRGCKTNQLVVFCYPTSQPARL
jgi:hypothetical protein